MNAPRTGWLGRIAPRSRAGQVRLGLMLMILVGLAGAIRLDRVARALWADKQEGDLVFQSLPRGPLVDAIEGVTGSEWSHCGVLMKRSGSWYVVEALGEVRWTPYAEWIVRGRGSRVEVYRVGDLASGSAGAGKLRGELMALTGRPYDFRYAPGDDEIYCSELVSLAYERGLGMRLADWDRLGDLNWKPHEAFIREMEVGPLPLDRRMITPVALTRSPKVTRIFPAVGTSG
jgi:Permuted papain-like amidase enzyme, YaeF/YiiX, C92 family